MINYNLLHIISILSLFIGLLFATFLFTAKTKNKQSNKIFGLFLVLSALDNIFLSKILEENTYNINKTIALTVFLQLPVFYLYVLSVCYSGFKLKTKHLFHSIPFIAVNLFLLTNFYGVNQDSIIIFFPNISGTFKHSFVHIFIHLQVFCYLVAVFFVLKRAKKIHLENYSSNTILFYKWLFQLTVVISTLHTFAILKNIYKFSDYENFYYWSKVLLVMMQLTVFCWYVLKALNAPNLFKSVDSNLKLTSNLIFEKDDKAGPEESIKNNKVEALLDYMDKEEPFLNSSLTIQDLANKMHLNAKETSILINHTIGRHFFDFVNEYRIEKAMRILENPSQNKLTVLEILYHVGFNSKSSFNAAFKKHTGTTPTLYRKRKKQLVA